MISDSDPIEITETPKLSFLDGYNLVAKHCLSLTKTSKTLLSINILNFKFSTSHL